FMAIPSAAGISRKVWRKTASVKAKLSVKKQCTIIGDGNGLGNGATVCLVSYYEIENRLLHTSNSDGEKKKKNGLTNNGHNTHLSHNADVKIKSKKKKQMVLQRMHRSSPRKEHTPLKWVKKIMKDCNSPIVSAHPLIH
ncbi:hypothetical protein Tcan_01151, partial [Toxocara canis]